MIKTVTVVKLVHLLIKKYLKIIKMMLITQNNLTKINRCLMRFYRYLICKMIMMMFLCLRQLKKVSITT